MTYQGYSKVATVVFVLFTVYPVVTKIIDGRLSHDYVHSALHLVSALFGAYAGWLATSAWPAKVFTWAVAVIYLSLGVVGWFIQGFFLESHFAVPLGPVDHVFHLGLAVFALIVIVRNSRHG